MWKHFKTNPKTRQVIWEHSSRIHLIISSHFCSEEGVFLLHRYWRQPHLEKNLLFFVLAISISITFKAFAKICKACFWKSLDSSHPLSCHPSLSLSFLRLCFSFCFYFCLCLCLSKGERSPQTALSRAKRPSLTLFLSLFLSLSLSLCLSLFFLCLCLCFSKYLTSRRPLPCQETGRVRFRCNKLEPTKWANIEHLN